MKRLASPTEDLPLDILGSFLIGAATACIVLFVTCALCRSVLLALTLWLLVLLIGGGQDSGYGWGNVSMSTLTRECSFDCVPGRHHWLDLRLCLLHRHLHLARVAPPAAHPQPQALQGLELLVSPPTSNRLAHSSLLCL